MSFKSLTLKKDYRTNVDDVVRSFYIPVLSRAISYERAVGFFSSSALIGMTRGICELVKHGGKIRLIASPALNDDDIKAIEQGYKSRDEVIKEALLRRLEDPTSYDELKKDRLGLLTQLIASEVMDIRIAFSLSQAPNSIYHEKIGLMKDVEKNIIAFNGSMNETLYAQENNYESFDVYCSWISEDEKERTIRKSLAFDSLWKNKESKVDVIEFPEIKEEIIKKYRRAKQCITVDYDEYSDYFAKEYEKQYKININDEVHKYDPKLPQSVELFDYQLKAINKWARDGYRGIFDMATGTGKTYTGIAAIIRLYKDLKCLNKNNKLLAFVLCPYKHLVEQWVIDLKKFNISPIVCYGEREYANWERDLKKAVERQKYLDEYGFVCAITTNNTFKSEKFQAILNRVTCNSLIMADEAHYLGAQKISKFLNDKFKYRIALSATIDRHNDEEGTAFLYKYFGNKVIEYTLKQAIDEERLTKYKYIPVIVNLTEEEFVRYKKLSFEINKCIVEEGDSTCLTDRGKKLAIIRSRVVAGAYKKLEALREAITNSDENYLHDYNMLVYCGATNIYDGYFYDENDYDGERQIDAVIKMLGEDLEMSVKRFTAEVPTPERTEMIEHFTNQKLQAIVAIKCLDEGVNIPGIKTAFILASSTNPKEYIQRRGRVLRKFKGKKLAEIYDFITLPVPLEDASMLDEEDCKLSKTLIVNELNRIKEFALSSINPSSSIVLFEKIRRSFHVEVQELND